MTRTPPLGALLSALLSFLTLEPSFCLAAASAAPSAHQAPGAPSDAPGPPQARSLSRERLNSTSRMATGSVSMSEGDASRWRRASV